MIRRQKNEEHANHERWLVSYADFITLLFAFFVVMYAISSINEGKYRVLSDSLVAAFKEPKKSFDPIQIGEMAKMATDASVEIISKPTLIKMPVMSLNNQDSDNGKMPGAGFASSPEHARDIRKIADEVTRAMQQLVDLGLVTIKLTDLWVEVEIKDSVLFTSGSARIRDEAVEVLRRVAAVLAGFPNPVRIEGFTDNVPISTRVYPSNWELSAARAASVVRLFERLDIAPLRLSAVGYGEHRPVAANDTAEGRAKNRRVVLVVLADKEVEHLLDERLRRTAPPVEARSADVSPAQAPGASADAAAGTAATAGKDPERRFGPVMTAGDGSGGKDAATAAAPANHTDQADKTARAGRTDEGVPPRKPRPEDAVPSPTPAARISPLGLERPAPQPRLEPALPSAVPDAVPAIGIAP